MTSSTAEIIKAALSKYNAYDADWEKAYFDSQSGGYNVYHNDHQFTPTGGGGNAEKIVGIMLANQGKQVKFLPENQEIKSPDIEFDGQTWDIKFIENANEETIRKCIRNAKKADNALFYFLNEEQYQTLHSAINREVTKRIKANEIFKIPNIYYIENQRLRSLWKK